MVTNDLCHGSVPTGKPGWKQIFIHYSVPVLMHIRHCLISNLLENHTIIRAAFVCVFVCLWVCSLSPPRSFDGSSPNLVGVCTWTSELPLRGSFSTRSTGRRVNGSLSLSTILYRDQPHTTQLQRRLLLGKQQSLNSAPFAVVHVKDVCRWIWQLLLRGSFSKTSTGRRVNGSNGSTGHFHYIIYDSR